MRFQITTDNFKLYLGGKREMNFLWDFTRYGFPGMSVYIFLSAELPQGRGGEVSAAHYFPQSSTRFLLSPRPCSHFLLLSS